MKPWLFPVLSPLARAVLAQAQGHASVVDAWLASGSDKIPAAHKTYSVSVATELCPRPLSAVQQREAACICTTGTRSCRFYRGVESSSCRCALAPKVREAAEYKPSAPAAKPATSGGWLAKFLTILGPLAGLGLSLYKKHQQQQDRAQRPSPVLQSSAYGLFSEVLKAYGLGFAYDTGRRAIVLPKATILLQQDGGATFKGPSGKISKGPNEALDYLFLFAKRLSRNHR